MHEMLARLLAVADDVDAAILLQFHRENGGVALAAHRARRRASRHGAQSFSGSASQDGFRQAAGDGGLEHGESSGKAAQGFQSGRQS